MRRLTIATCVTFCVLLASASYAGNYSFELKFTEAVQAQPYTGRVYIFFGSNAQREPRTGPDWFRPEPFIALDVRDWKPQEPLRIASSDESRLLAFPRPLSELDLKNYSAQAVLRSNPHEQKVGTGQGNAFSVLVAVKELGGEDSPQAMLIEKVVPAPPLRETESYRVVQVKSGLLSAFHSRDVQMRAAVQLPPSYHQQPARRYPVIFEVPGFGGTHLYRSRSMLTGQRNVEDIEFIRVMLDPSCRLGHHVFADSANNGPVGRALIEEFIPELDRQFRTVPQPTARFLTGHSSGGWSSLWLQTTYPDVFGGTWSTSPDPVDFHDFQRIDLYQADENLYRDASGARRALSRAQRGAELWFDTFDRMEAVLGPGGQLHSFEAVFSPRGPDGEQLRAWDRKTGSINASVIEAWKKYDIRLILESRWPELGPKLAGKLHVFMGDQDTFYLEGATRLLKTSLEKLGSDAVIEIVPGRNHSDLLSPDLLDRIHREMQAAYLRHHGKPEP